MNPKDCKDWLRGAVERVVDNEAIVAPELGAIHLEADNAAQDAFCNAAWLGIVFARLVSRYDPDKKEAMLDKLSDIAEELGELLP